MKKYVQDKMFPQFPKAISYLIDEEAGTVECRIEKNFAMNNLMLSDKHFTYKEIDFVIMNVYTKLIDKNVGKYIVGVAKCNKELDTFDEKKGMQIAFNKAMLTTAKLTVQYYNEAICSFQDSIASFQNEKERKLRDIELYEGRLERVRKGE